MGGTEVCVQMRKKRNVSSVMGWLLRRQLSEPGAGVCCAVSMAGWETVPRWEYRLTASVG